MSPNIDVSGTLRSALVYFGLVFGAGFLLGVVRTLWLVPSLGERAAELLETPFMLVFVWLTARFVVRRMETPTLARRLQTGGLALLLLVLAELGVVLFVRGQSLRDYVASRDAVSGSVYLLALALFAAAPAVVDRRAHERI